MSGVKYLGIEIYIPMGFKGILYVIELDGGTIEIEETYEKKETNTN
jgi:hypothetical protein